MSTQALSVADFAAKVKAKYPSYANVPDEELARKIVAKHPDYASQVTFAAPPEPPAPAAPRTIQDSANDLVGLGPRGAAGILPTAGGVVTGAAKDAARAGIGFGRLALRGVGVPSSPRTDAMFDTADQALQPSGKDQENGAILSTMLQFAGGGELAAAGTKGLGLTARATGQAAASGATAAARGGSPGEVAGQAAAGAAGPILGEAGKRAARAISGRLINSLIKPLEKEFRFGRDPGTAVADEGIVAHSKQALLDGIDAKKKEVGQAIGAKLTAANAQNSPLIDLAPMTQPLRDAADKALRVGDNALAQRLTDFAEAPIFKAKPVVTPAEAAEVKRLIGEATTWTGETFDKPVNQAKAEVYRALNDAIDKAVPGVKALNARYANLLSASKSLERTAHIQERQSMVSLPTLGFGGLGTALGGPAGGLSMIALKKAAETTLARTAGAQGARGASAAATPAALLAQRILSAIAAREAEAPPPAP